MTPMTPRDAAIEAVAKIFDNLSCRIDDDTTGRNQAAAAEFLQRWAIDGMGSSPLGPDAVATTGGTSLNPLSRIADLAVDLGPPNLSETFRGGPGSDELRAVASGRESRWCSGCDAYIQFFKGKWVHDRECCEPVGLGSDELRAAAAKVIEGFGVGVFVRNIEGDGAPG